MADSTDNDEADDAADEGVDLHGRLRNPGPNTTEIENHGEADDAVDSVGDRLRSDEPPDPSGQGPSLEEQSDSADVAAEDDLEDSLLDALDSDAEDLDSHTDSRSGTSPGTGDVSSAAEDLRSRPDRDDSSPDPGRTDGDTDEAGQVCPECNSISPTGMRFCVQCGASLRDDDSSTGDSSEDDALSVDRNRLDDEVPSGFALVAINDDGTDGKSIDLRRAETVVGREGDDRFPTDEFLDPEHSRLTIEDGDLYIEDLESLNGTYTKLRDDVRLEPGDTFLMGRQVLRFERIEQDFDSKKTAEDGTRFMGSPAPGGDYKLLQIGVGDLVQNIYCLPESGVVLGREKGDIIFPRDKFMSGRHARIFTEDGPRLVDLNSSNGTWIKIWDKQKLDSDDYVFMGQQLFRIEFPD